jgi:hypothetical protein
MEAQWGRFSERMNNHEIEMLLFLFLFCFYRISWNGNPLWVAEYPWWFYHVLAQTCDWLRIITEHVSMFLSIWYVLQCLSHLDLPPWNFLQACFLSQIWTCQKWRDFYQSMNWQIKNIKAQEQGIHWMLAHKSVKRILRGSKHRPQTMR